MRPWDRAKPDTGAEKTVETAEVLTINPRLGKMELSRDIKAERRRQGMAAEHTYSVRVKWTGNLGTGTSHYRAYSRDHIIAGEPDDSRPTICGSADPAFRGDGSKWNPEQLLLSSLAQCHMLWYLHLAAEAGITVMSYVDHPTGTMVEHADGSGEFTEAILRPHVVISADSDTYVAHRLHERVPEVCFIARSVNFPVQHDPVIDTRYP